MAGQDPKKLLRSMQPGLSGGKRYLATVPEDAAMSLAGYLRYITCIFREE